MSSHEFAVVHTKVRTLTRLPEREEKGQKQEERGQKEEEKEEEEEDQQEVERG